jgi:hypothetical protein
VSAHLLHASLSELWPVQRRRCCWRTCNDRTQHVFLLLLLCVAAVTSSECAFCRFTVDVALRACMHASAVSVLFEAPEFVRELELLHAAGGVDAVAGWLCSALRRVLKEHGLSSAAMLLRDPEILRQTAFVFSRLPAFRSRDECVCSVRVCGCGCVCACVRPSVCALVAAVVRRCWRAAVHFFFRRCRRERARTLECAEARPRVNKHPTVPGSCCGCDRRVLVRALKGLLDDVVSRTTAPVGHHELVH